jgi:hypothetical protein
MIMRLTPAERLAMACRMFSTARALAVAGLRAQDPSLAGERLKRALLKRFYERDLDADHFDRIQASLGQPNRPVDTDDEGCG